MLQLIGERLLIGMADIERLEASIGARLPGAYVRFLLAENFRRVDGLHRFRFLESFDQEEGENGEEAHLHSLHHICPAALLPQDGSFTLVGYDILAIHATMTSEWRHPRSMLPIASDPGGMKVFLSVHPQSYGRLFVAGRRWSERYQADAPIAHSDYGHVARSFGDFVDLLQRV